MCQVAILDMKLNKNERRVICETSRKVFGEYRVNLSILYLKRPANFELSV